MAKLLSEGAFGSLGGNIDVVVDIVPDPATIASELMTVATELEDTMKPMLVAREIAREDIQAHFDTESDPDGDRWAELDVTYADYKESLGYPRTILQRTQDLMKAATSKEAFTVTPVGLWFNWDALPHSVHDGANYGKIHQAGSADEIKVLKDENGNDVKSYFGIGPGHALPARPFVGASQDAEAAFWAVFDKWFDEAVDVVIHPSGRMQTHKGGKFGPNVRF